MPDSTKGTETTSAKTSRTGAHRRKRQPGGRKTSTARRWRKSRGRVRGNDARSARSHRFAILADAPVANATWNFSRGPISRIGFPGRSLRATAIRLIGCRLATHEGGQFAVALPRGSGKTTLGEVEVIRAVVYGFRRFVVLLQATEPLAAQVAPEDSTRTRNQPAARRRFPGSLLSRFKHSNGSTIAPTGRRSTARRRGSNGTRTVSPCRRSRVHRRRVR